MTPDRSLLKRIPAVDALLRAWAERTATVALSPPVRVALIREELDATRRGYLAGELGPEALAMDALIERLQARAAALPSPPLRRVINATGILIHTNLGRSPLSATAQQAVSRIQGGYCNLELDLTSGRRTSRLGRVRDLLRRVTGASDALAVNNNAAAVFLALHVLAARREVIVSRGELVEIGGSFRLPDIMAAGGVALREVGTTNRTRLADYEEAIGPQTAMLLKVHPSNFQISGYTQEVSTADLAGLAKRHDLVMMEDLGSGALDQHPGDFLRREPRVQAALAAGAGLVCFSGDKLLGGPQAGILLGDAAHIGPLRAHPLARVVRLDKLHLAALEATLLDYLAGEEELTRIPLYRMMRRGREELRRMGAELLARVQGVVGPWWNVRLVDTAAAAGGGSLPGETLPSVGLELSCTGGSTDALARHLRAGDPAIMGRIEQDRLVLDLRSLLEEDWTALGDLLAERLPAFEREAAGGKG